MWLLNRLSERTTWNGIAMIIAGIALLGSRALVNIVASVIIVVGVAVFLWSEPD